jgi:hypothetical protein
LQIHDPGAGIGIITDNAPPLIAMTTASREEKSNKRFTREENNMWNQIYNPLGNAALSTITAAVPVIALLL